jgi:ribonuclease HI
MKNSFRVFTKPGEIDNGPPGRRYIQNELEEEAIVYTDGSCVNQGQTEVRAGSGAWFGTNNEKNISARVPGKDQSNQIAELYAILLAVKATPPDAPLTIMTDSRFALDGLTKNLEDWENKGWVGARHAQLFKTTTAWLRYRGQPTKLQWVKGHSGIEGNEKADELAGIGAQLPRPVKNEIDHSQPPAQILPGARLSDMTQKTLYQGIRRQKTLKKRNTTNRNLDLTREAVLDTTGLSPTNQLIWHSMRHEDLSRNIRDYMWKSMHGALKIGDYWSNIPGLEDRGECTLCGQTETMEHILTICATPARKQIWDLVNSLWLKRHNEAFEPSLGNVLGCGMPNFTADEKPLTGKTRLYKILISESAFLIWKLRCERAIAGKTHSETEIHNRWIGTINSRLTIDCVLTDARAFERKALSGKLIQSTWHKCLMNESDLPDDWYLRTGVLVGIATKTSARVPHEAG